jgi:crotonobetainyl-CoA:carnitine CoA-transferase CaiB-like acyl-CoA transferase
MAGPLSHVRVLDMTRVLAGPWTGQNLGDLGADVIKIERPGKGDDSRAFAPPYIKDEAGRETKESAYFCCANRGKRSVTVDISKPEGAQLVRELAAKVDVLLENYKFGDLTRYGLGYEQLKEINPRLIYCSITGFGQTGPDREKPGYDFMIQGMGGIMSVTGERGEGPQRVGIPIADIMTGMYSSIAVCAALAHRAETGKGQHLDLALLDCQVAVLAYQAMNYLSTGVPPGRTGNVHPNIVPYQPFHTADGDVIIACGNDNLFKKFCEVADCAHLLQDPRFATNADRVRNRAEIEPLIDAITRKRTTKAWVGALEAAGVPCGPINNLAQVFEEPQVKARGMLQHLPHSSVGKVPQVVSPMKFSATPLEFRSAPPVLGEHTDQVLREVLGRSDADIAALRAAKAI